MLTWNLTAYLFTIFGSDCYLVELRMATMWKLLHFVVISCILLWEINVITSLLGVLVGKQKWTICPLTWYCVDLQLQTNILEKLTGSVFNFSKYWYLPVSLHSICTERTTSDLILNSLTFYRLHCWTCNTFHNAGWAMIPHHISAWTRREMKEGRCTLT